MSKKIIDMTPEEIRLEVAKARGIRAEKLEQVSYSMWLREWLDPGTIVEVFDAGACCDIRELPNWTKRIEHAWELVEEMRISNDGIFHLEYRAGCDPDDWNKFQWVCEFVLRAAVVMRVKFESVLCYADTAPLAICRAYLIWRSEK